MEELVKRARVHEEDMIRLLTELEPYVYRIAYHLTLHQQDAEDVAQEALYKICTKLSHYRGDSSLQTWVYALVLNTFKDSIRKQKKRQTVELKEDLAIRSFEKSVDDQLTIETAMKELSEVDRQILVLRFQNQLPVKEVANILRMTESNVKTRIFRMREKLRLFVFPGGEML